MVDAVDERIVAALARGTLDRPAWLDGGPSAGGWFGSEPDLELAGDDIRLLDEVQDRWNADRSRVWIGWMTYEFGVDTLLGRDPIPRRLPGLCLRRYPAVWSLNPTGLRRGVGGAAALGRLERAVGTEPEAPPPRWPFGPLRAQWSEHDYRRRVDRALAHIAAGDTYQVNLSQPFFAPYRGTPTTPVYAAVQAYRAMRARAPAPMGAFIAVGPGPGADAIVSNSPETLLDLRIGTAEGGEDRASSQPIKGTRPRAVDPQEDAAAIADLLASTKDRAEHVMIVDLVRNDLGQWARPGTVVARGPTPWSLPTVHHLVTDVSCTLRPAWTLRDLVLALFPGGSVTGAPKRRTVQLIDDIEGEPRGIYCGAIAVLAPDGVRMSIPIRTGLIGVEGLSLRSGGGIVIDSDPESERVETEVKARAFNPSFDPS